MVFFLLIPLFLALVVLTCGLVLYRRMQDTLPAFQRGSFWRIETRLLKIFEGLLESEIADKLDRQIRYFISRGKYWRFDDDSVSGVELCQDHHEPLAEEVLYDFQEDCALAEIHFELKGIPHTITFQATDGRLWGWRVSPPLTKGAKVSQLKINEVRLLEHPELAIRPENLKSEFPVEIYGELASAFVGRRS